MNCYLMFIASQLVVLPSLGRSGWFSSVKLTLMSSYLKGNDFITTYHPICKFSHSAYLCSFNKLNMS